MVPGGLGTAWCRVACNPPAFWLLFCRLAVALTFGSRRRVQQEPPDGPADRHSRFGCFDGLGLCQPRFGYVSAAGPGFRIACRFRRRRFWLLWLLALALVFGPRRCIQQEPPTSACAVSGVPADFVSVRLHGSRLTGTRVAPVCAVNPRLR